jgi:glycosyltransferase involved in cell wall biosynthesis
VAVFAFIQHRLGRTDGVSLEVDKWRGVLQEMGHTVRYIAGNDDVPGGSSVPELYPFHPRTERIIRNATRKLVDYGSGKELLDDVQEHSRVVEKKLRALIDELRVDIVIPNNLLSVGYNLPGMLALSRILEESGKPAICHHHDFWWEDSGEVHPTCEEVQALYRSHAPPALPNCVHVVINSIARRELQRRRGLDSVVVPNAFDFSQPVWGRDEYNHDLRDAFGIGKSDILMLQATRVLDRKAIELSIDIVAALSRPECRQRLEATALYDGRRFGPADRIVLLCAGYVEGIGLSDSYADNLQSKADELGVKLVWAGERIGHSRGRTTSGEKGYSLWDSYAVADHVTYPSIWEGWGNQFVEAVFARLPVVLFEYPVWTSDLAHLGFKVATLGDTIAGRDERGLVTVARDRLDSAVEQVIEYLTDPQTRSAATEHNVRIARRDFSMNALRDHIGTVLNRIGVRNSK